MNQLYNLTAKNGKSDINVFQDDTYPCLYFRFDDFMIGGNGSYDCYLENKHLDKIKSYKSLSALVKFAKVNAINPVETFCPPTALTDEGQPQTAESTPQDKTVSNGVPVSNPIPNNHQVTCFKCGHRCDDLKITLPIYPKHPKYENLPLDDDIPPMYGLGV